MAWTAPATFTDGAVLTAAQMNAMRDNFNETAPAKASAAGQYFVATGLNAVAARTAGNGKDDNAGTRTSSSYGNLTAPAVAGPAATVTSGTSAIVAVSASIASDTTNTAVLAGYAISGATTLAGSNATAVLVDGLPATQTSRSGVVNLESALTAGSNVFTMQYKAFSGGVQVTAAFRQIVVLPF